MEQRKINVRNKRAIIEISLVSESREMKNEQIEKDITDELSEGIIPWCKQIEKVVVEEKTIGKMSTNASQKTSKP